MKPRSVAFAVAILVVMLALGYVLVADEGGTFVRWLASLHGRPGGH